MRQFVSLHGQEMSTNVKAKGRKAKERRMKYKRAFFITTYIFLLFFFLWQCLFKPLVDEFVPLGPIRTDVAKRIKSPDSSKVAILIRRNAWDLNFAIKIKEKLRTRTLHWTRDFRPDLKVDWNERIVWSNDSSLIVLTIDDISNNNEKYMWAYDFNSNKEYFEKDKIIEIMNYKNANVED